MKTIHFFSSILMVSLVLVSCKKEQEKESTTSTNPSSEIVVDSIQKDISTPETVALNPPHGQPNHRCDIAVGAPLNTPVRPNSFYQEPVIPNNTNSQIQQQSNPIATPNTPRPKFNPPHGQPHHDCKIQVGDPLPDA